jgi:hypothetical protein
MNDTTVKDLITELVKKLEVEYGAIEIKVHNGKWTNYTISVRVNYNESETRDLLTRIKE